MPMRNDVSEMEAIKKSAYNKLSADEKKSKNYLVLDKNGVNVVISETYREFNYWLRQNLNS